MPHPSPPSTRCWHLARAVAPGAAFLLVQTDGPRRRRRGRRDRRRCCAAAGGTVAVSHDRRGGRPPARDPAGDAPGDGDARATALIEDVVGAAQRACRRCSTRSRAIERAHGIVIPTVAHAGDGNLHPNFIFDAADDGCPTHVWAAADDLFRAALALGGTLTGEHGIGVLKRRWLADELGDDSVGAAAPASRRVFDPAGILQPRQGLRAVTAPQIFVSAAVITDAAGRVLVVRKHGTSVFMQPGGKPEAGESAAAGPLSRAARGDRARRRRRQSSSRSARSSPLRPTSRVTASSLPRSAPLAEPGCGRRHGPRSPSCGGSPRPTSRRWPSRRSASTTCSQSPGPDRRAPRAQRRGSWPTRRVEGCRAAACHARRPLLRTPLGDPSSASRAADLLGLDRDDHAHLIAAAVPAVRAAGVLLRHHLDVLGPPSSVMLIARPRTW